MTTKILKHAVIVLLLAGVFSSCSKKMNNAGDEPVAIIGRWKLVKVTAPFTPTGTISYDYSRHTIVYEFNTDGILTVFGETGNIDRYIGHETGEYPYSILDADEAKEAASFAGFRLKIGNLYYLYNVSYKGLEINGAPLDDFIYYLVYISQ